MEDVVYKVCCRCLERKELDQFYINRSCKDGFNSSCKVCNNKSKSIFYKINSEKIKERNTQYKKENPEKVRSLRKKWREENPEKVRIQNVSKIRQWREENPEKIKSICEKWRKENPEKIKETAKKRRLNLSTSYIIKNIKKSTHLSSETIKEHPELIETNRMQIKFKRLLKNKKDENSKTS